MENSCYFQPRHVHLVAWRRNPYSRSVIMFLGGIQRCILKEAFTNRYNRRGANMYRAGRKRLVQLQNCVTCAVPIATVGAAQVLFHLAPECAAGSLRRALNMCLKMGNSYLQLHYAHPFVWRPNPYSRAAIMFLHRVQKCTLGGLYQPIYRALRWGSSIFSGTLTTFLPRSKSGFFPEDFFILHDSKCCLGKRLRYANCEKNADFVFLDFFFFLHRGLEVIFWAGQREVFENGVVNRCRGMGNYCF